MNRHRLSLLLAASTHLFISLALTGIPAAPEAVATFTGLSDPSTLSIEERAERLTKTLENPPEDQPGAPHIPTLDELTLPDEDPDNTAAFSATNAGFSDEPVDTEVPAFDTEALSPLLTPEQSAERIKALEEKKQEALAQAEKEEEEKAKEAKKRENLFETNLTGLKEAGVDVTKQGVACTGRINIWTDQYARLTFAATTDGILAQAYMNKLDIGPLEISGVGFDGQYGTDDDGVIVELKLTKKKQRLTISGMIELIGSLSRVDLILGSEAFTFFSHINILKYYEMKVLAESRGKGKDLDFVIMAAAKKDFINFIEKMAIKAVGSITDTTADGIKKLEREVAKTKRAIKKMKQGQRLLRKKFTKAEQAYRRKTRHAEKAIAPLRKSIRTLEKQVGKLKSEIWSLRRKFIAGREKTLGGLREAKKRVNSLSSEVDRAKRALRKAKRRAHWTRPWMYAVVAAQAIRLGVVEAARWSAVKVLEGLMSLINIWPIDATPPLPVLWAAYGPAYAALKSAHVALTTAMLAANPLAMKEYGEMIAIGIAISANQLTILSLQTTLLTVQTSLIAARKAATAAGDVAEFGMKAVAFLAKNLVPVRILGAAVQFSLRELLSGVLPKLTLMTRVFGARKNLQMQLDLKRPDQFALQFPKMFVQILSPGSSGPDVMAEIESARLQFKESFDIIDQQKEAAEKNKSSWEQKDDERRKEVARIKSEANRAMTASLAKYKMTKGEGIYGSKLDLENEDANFKKSYDEFDPKDPSSYLVSQRYNNYRWVEQWKLPKVNSGSVIFMADAQRDIQVGFHSTAGAPEKEHLLDFIIGSHGNQGTLLRNNKGEIIAQSRDPEARVKVANADDFEMKTYWISYHNGYIACGHGDTPGQNLILEWQLKNPPEHIEYFSFSCHDNRIQYGAITAGNAFSREFGSRYSAAEGFNTFAWPKAFTLPEQDAGTITFKAKADRDVIVGFTNDSSKKHARILTRIGMDGNTRSGLATVSADGKEYNHATITEDRDAVVQGGGGSYHPYWVTYLNNYIIFGKGDDPTQNIMLEAALRNPARSISRFSFSCWDNNIEVRDIKIQKAVPVATGTRHSAVNQKEINSYREEWKLPQTGKGTITWEAKGTSDMIIALHTSDNPNPQNHTYQAVIGAESNSRTLIRNASNQILTSTSDPDGVITEVDNYNRYWLTYDAGTESSPGYIAVGKGSIPGANIILEHRGTNDPITHFSFSNKEGFVSFSNIAARTLIPVPRGSQYSAAARNKSFEWLPEWFIPTVSRGGVILFRARAHDSIMVGLSSKRSGKAEYEVALGADGNTRSYIKDYNGNVLAQSDYRIIDSNNFYGYWVWYDRASKKLRCGHGFDHTENVILSTSLPDAPELGFFGFSSDASPILYKEIGSYDRNSKILAYRAQLQDSTYHAVAEQGRYQWKEEWKLPKPDAGSVVFTARGSKNIQVGLHTGSRSAPGAFTYDVIIGNANNGETIIRKNNGTVGARSIDPDARIRGVGNFSTYWVSYYKGHIRLGRGVKLGENLLLEWSDPDKESGITHFSLSSLDTLVTYRDVTTAPAERAPLFTTYSAANANGHFIWPEQWKLSEAERGAFTFEAKAERDITLGIARRRRDGPLYIATIGAGGNKQSAITKARVVKTNNGPDGRIKDVKSYQPYWILYDRGYIAVGHGITVGEDTIIEWQDPRPTLLGQYLSLSGANNQVSYRNISTAPLPKGSFRRFKHFTSAAANKTYTYRNAWKLPDEGGVITFRAHAEENIRIGLHDHKGANTRDFTYEIGIGARGNTETHIKNKSGNVVKKTTSSNATILIPGQAAQYWVSYKDGNLAVGSGGVPGEETILTWRDPVARGKINYFALSSGTKEIRYSNVKVGPYTKTKETSRYIATNRNSSYFVKQKWKLPQPGNASVTCTVQANKDAMIGFLRGLQGSPVYDVIIGAEDNSATILRRDAREVARIHHKIKNFDPHPYWFSVRDGVVSFGQGTAPGEDQLMQWEDPNPRAVSYFGFSNSENDATFDQIALKEGHQIDRGSFFRAERLNGRMIWNRELWKIKPNSTLSMTANAPQADMRIGLRSQGTGHALYTIRLGGWRNTKCVIMKGSQIIAETNKTLKLGIKKLWITNVFDREKKELRLVVGTGKPGHKVLLDVTVPNVPNPVKNFGLSSGDSMVIYDDFATHDPVTEQIVEVSTSKDGAPATKEEEAIDDSIDAFEIDTDALVTVAPVA